MTRAELEGALAREAGATDEDFGQATGCRAAAGPRRWVCDVTYDVSSAGVPYAVTVRPGASCFDARRDDRRTRRPAAGAQERIPGCGYLWQWRLL